MAEPSRRTSRLAIAGATLALIAATGAGFLLGRSTGDTLITPKAVSTPAVVPTPAPTPIPIAKPKLGKGDLIAAAALAADAAAAGRRHPAALDDVADRDFVLRLPFSCPGRSEAGQGDLQATYDEKTQALRVRAPTVRWPPDQVSSGTAAMDDENATDIVEGFWISRPWTASEACPTAAGGSEVPGAPDQTLALAQIFTADDSRVGQRDGKAFETIERIAPEALDLSLGLRLKLTGKVARWPGSGPFLCRALGGIRPVCILAVTLDTVTVENPATSETLASWDVASQRRDTAER